MTESTGWRRLASTKEAGAAPCSATARKAFPSYRYRAPNLASHTRVAFASIASKTGSKSPGELLITWRISDVAVCCSSASVSRSEPRRVRACILRAGVLDRQKPALSFDHLVGAHQERRRHVEGESPRRFQVEDRFVFGRRLHWKIGRIGTAQDAIDVGCRLPVLLDHVDAIGHQATRGDEVPESIDRRQTVARRERDDEVAIVISRNVWWQEEATVRRTRKGRDRLFDGGSIILDRRRCDFDSERGRDRLR